MFASKEFLKFCRDLEVAVNKAIDQQTTITYEKLVAVAYKPRRPGQRLVPHHPWVSQGLYSLMLDDLKDELPVRSSVVVNASGKNKGMPSEAYFATLSAELGDVFTKTDWQHELFKLGVVA